MARTSTDLFQTGDRNFASEDESEDDLPDAEVLESPGFPLGVGSTHNVNTIVQPSITVQGSIHRLNFTKVQTVTKRKLMYTLQSSIHRLQVTATFDWKQAQQILDDWFNEGAWSLSSKEHRLALEAFKMAQKKIGSQKLPAVIYRGFILKKTQLKQALSKGFPIKKYAVSSWTADAKQALWYASHHLDYDEGQRPLEDEEVGVVVAIRTPKTALLYMDASTAKKILGIRLFSPQKEVVLEGSGIKQIDRNNILAIVEDKVPQKLHEYEAKHRK
jgi:hypothetical protein